MIKIETTLLLLLAAMASRTATAHMSVGFTPGQKIPRTNLRARQVLEPRPEHFAHSKMTRSQHPKYVEDHGMPVPTNAGYPVSSKTPPALQPKMQRPSIEDQLSFSEVSMSATLDASSPSYSAIDNTIELTKAIFAHNKALSTPSSSSSSSSTSSSPDIEDKPAVEDPSSEEAAPEESNDTASGVQTIGLRATAIRQELEDSAASSASWRGGSFFMMATSAITLGVASLL